jgi:hypothetical protein
MLNVVHSIHSESAQLMNCFLGPPRRDSAFSAFSQRLAERDTYFLDHHRLYSIFFVGLFVFTVVLGSFLEFRVDNVTFVHLDLLVVVFFWFLSPLGDPLVSIFSLAAFAPQPLSASDASIQSLIWDSEIFVWLTSLSGCLGISSARPISFSAGASFALAISSSGEIFCALEISCALGIFSSREFSFVGCLVVPLLGILVYPVSG